jgi:hypothetical protein
MGRISTKSQALAEPKKPTTSRTTRKGAEKSVAAPSVFDIPYFAHMQLNPARYPMGKLNYVLMP